jgi:shikimate dehydrogenase
MNSVYGLIGEKLAHSFSPHIHSLLLQELNLIGNYCLYETDKEALPLLISQLKESGVKGVNVTIPYKVEIMRYMDQLSDSVKKIGSVNTVSFSENSIKGYNTDYDGFKMMLDYFNISLKGQRCVVLGTGGASKSVIQSLSDSGVESILIVSRKELKQKKDYSGFEIVSYQQLSSIKKDVIVNCTPCGMHPAVNASPVSLEQIHGAEICIDLIYNPSQTLFMKMADSLNIKNFNGLYMLVGQAVRAQEIWNNISINPDVVERIYRKVSLQATL